MFRSSPFKRFFLWTRLIREYYPRVASLWGNGCFSLIARAGSLHPGGLTRAPLPRSSREFASVLCHIVVCLNRPRISRVGLLSYLLFNGFRPFGHPVRRQR